MFRSDYIDYATLTAQLQRWAEDYPQWVRLRSLARTPEGREVWLLVLGEEPERVRPAVWVDGNMHAEELAGTAVALSIAEDVLELLRVGTLDGLPEVVAQRARQCLYYIVPRISPDGAESVLTTGRFVRSVPRDERVDRSRPRWRTADMDGDGQIRTMRLVDPAGDFVEDREFPGLMLLRSVEDPGPYFRLYPEGTIDNFDGQNVPSPEPFLDAPLDLNRNFPWRWAPPHEQLGAGPYPLSEPESRGVVDFATQHPEIFAWLNLHTYGGVAIRPRGHGPDERMAPFDLAVYRQVEEWMLRFTGYPMVSGFHEFLYEPDKPLCGDLTDYAYEQRGALAYVVELWDLFHRLGRPRPKRFVEHYQQFGSSDMVALAEWDRRHNGSHLFAPWRSIHHPQLGAVEVGGVDPRFGIWNPTRSELPGICKTQSLCFLHVAALGPTLVLSLAQVPLGGGLSRVDVTVENRGYLPTHVLASALGLDFNEPLSIRCEVEGCELVEPSRAHAVLGHLAGWGRGRFGASSPLNQPLSNGTGHRAQISYWVRGRGRLALTVGACRTGWIEGRIEVGAPDTELRAPSAASVGRAQ